MLHASSPPTHTQLYPTHTHTHTLTHTLKLYFPSAVRVRLTCEKKHFWHQTEMGQPGAAGPSDAPTQPGFSLHTCLMSSVGICIVLELRLLVLSCCFSALLTSISPGLFDKPQQAERSCVHQQAKRRFRPVQTKLKGPRCLQTEKGYFA